jgi:hypothetical protein
MSNDDIELAYFMLDCSLSIIIYLLTNVEDIELNLLFSERGNFTVRLTLMTNLS